MRIFSFIDNSTQEHETERNRLNYRLLTSAASNRNEFAQPRVKIPELITAAAMDLPVQVPACASVDVVVSARLRPR